MEDLIQILTGVLVVLFSPFLIVRGIGLYLKGLFSGKKEVFVDNLGNENSGTDLFFGGFILTLIGLFVFSIVLVIPICLVGFLIFP